MNQTPSSEEGESRPVPCPECESTRGYIRVGQYRAQCLNCNALLKNREVNLSDEEQS